MARQAIDMTGERYGKLTVISRAENTKANKAQWLCRCDCGNYKIITRHSLMQNTKSCGCSKGEFISQRMKTHGMKKTRLYRIWSGMKDRCLNPKSKYWNAYGGRGITIFQDWIDSFESFRDWAYQSGYSEKLTIDRIDNNKGYSPDNCRWATYKEQENNRRNNHILTINGISKTASEWADYYGISSNVFISRIDSGWSIEKAISTPLKRRKQK